MAQFNQSLQCRCGDDRHSCRCLLRYYINKHAGRGEAGQEGSEIVAEGHKRAEDAEDTAKAAAKVR